MSNQIFCNNINALKNHYENIAKSIENKEYQLMEKVEVYSEISKTGDKIFRVKTEDKLLYINAKYNPKAFMDNWFLEQNKFEQQSVIVTVGFGNALHIKRLLEETPQSVILIVYEPCINVFMKAMEEIDLEDVFLTNKMALVIDGLNDDDTSIVLNSIIKFDNLTLLHHLVLSNYSQLFYEKVKNFIDIEKKRLDTIKRSYGTTLYFTDVNGKNVLNNISYLYDNYTAFQLKNILPEEVPCIIVAAGPSLNKNIMDLKKAKNRACIIATDTALKPLLNHGIMPDFVVIVDGRKPGILFDHELLSEVPMIMSSVASSEPVNMHKGKKYFFWDGTNFETELIKTAKLASNDPDKIDICSIATGGSVATTAFSFGKLLGSKTIILVGQDLALTGNKTHADGTFQEKMDEIDTSNQKYIQVEDIYGNMVLTQQDYKSYLDWFNEVIPASKDVHVIDATEGGAKITGTEILTLNDAIDKVCKCQIHVKEILERIPPVFFENEVKNKVSEFFQNTPNRFLEVKEKAEKGIKHYEKLLKLCNKKSANANELIKISNKIKVVNEFMNSDGVALMVIDSIRDIDYSLRATIYKTEENDKDERIMIARQGKVFLEAIIQRIDGLKQIADETVGMVGK